MAWFGLEFASEKMMSKMELYIALRTQQKQVLESHLVDKTPTPNACPGSQTNLTRPARRLTG